MPILPFCCIGLLNLLATALAALLFISFGLDWTRRSYQRVPFSRNCLGNWELLSSPQLFIFFPLFLAPLSWVLLSWVHLSSLQIYFGKHPSCPPFFQEVGMDSHSPFELNFSGFMLFPPFQ